MTDELNGGEDIPSSDDMPATAAPSVDPDRVARWAYQRYQVRGGAPGQDQHDWYEAERELIAAENERE
jgi:Protein of unknown function (DUF2934)